MKTKNDYTPFKVSVVRWKADKFMSLPTFFRNRDVESRVSKMVKRLERGALPTQLFVAVGKAMSNFGPYKKGDFFRLDGHTRTDAWKVNPNLIPNVPLFVAVYEINNYEQVMKIYNDIDSSESVETPVDKVTGLLRERNYEAHSATIRKGKFSTAIKNACRNLHTADGVYLNGQEYNNKFHVKLDYFWEELTFIDQMGLDNVERFSGNVLTSLLMVAKKYGTKNKRLKALIKNYQDGVTSVATSTHVDGVHYVYNILYPEYQSTWTILSFTNAQDMIVRILYCFDKFMKNESIPKKAKLLETKKLKEFYQEYL